MRRKVKALTLNVVRQQHVVVELHSPLRTKADATLGIACALVLQCVVESTFVLRFGCRQKDHT